MASLERLMGVGVPNEQAKRTGFFILALATAGTAAGPGNVLVRASGESANLSGFDLGDTVQIMFVTTGTLYPGSNDRIGLKTTASGLVCTAGVMKTLTKFDQNTWFADQVTA